MVDPYLAAIVEAAEGGSKCPQLWMTLTSGDLVVGTPMASDIFVSGTHKAVVHANTRPPKMLEGQQKISERRATPQQLPTRRSRTSPAQSSRRKVVRSRSRTRPSCAVAATVPK